MPEYEEFSPSKELEDKLAKLAGVKVKQSGGRREGSGRKKKDGSNPKPIKPEKPKKVNLVKKATESPRLDHSLDSLLSNRPAKQESSRGHLTKGEVIKSVAEKLNAMGFDPVLNMVDMFKNPDVYGLEGKDLIRINSDLIKYVHPSQKAIEKKESKEYTINVVRKNYVLDDNGKVIDI